MKKKFHSINLKIFLSYLIIFLPLLMISGPFLTDLSIIIVAICFLFLEKEKKFFYNFFFLFFLFFYFVLIISSFFSEFKLLSFKSSIFYIRFGLFTLFFLSIIDYDKKILNKFFFVLFFCFTILIIDSSFQYIHGVNLLNMKAIHSSRMSSFFGDELIMGGYLMRLTPLLLCLAFLNYNENKHKKYLPLCVIFILLIQFAIFLSGERTSFFLFCFSIILYLIFINNFKFTKYLLLLSYGLLTMLLITTNTDFKKRIIDRTFNQTNILKTNSKKFIFSKQYNDHYLSAWKIFLDNKIIGIGPKNFREICKKEKYKISNNSCSTHPHNIAVQLLSETGFLGFLFYLLLNIFLWGNLIKSLIYKLYFKKLIFSNSEICLLICYVIIFFPIAPFGNFFNNWISAVVYLPAAIFLWMAHKNYKAYIGLKYINNILSKKHKI
jgi:O-antigen ligase